MNLGPLNLNSLSTPRPIVLVCFFAQRMFMRFMMASPKVAIVGAGPVGCMLARILSLSDIPVTVFESDHSPDYRSVSRPQLPKHIPHPYRQDLGDHDVTDAGLYVLAHWRRRAPKTPSSTLHQNPR